MNETTQGLCDEDIMKPKLHACDRCNKFVWEPGAAGIIVLPKVPALVAITQVFLAKMPFLFVGHIKHFL